MVGFHWFEHADQPKEGRFDGENSNYGLVTIEDRPWDVLVQRMTEVNAGLEARHARSTAGHTE
jgi:agarase